MKLLEPESVFPKGVMAMAWLTCPTSLQPFCVARGQAGRLLGDGIIPKLLKNSSTRPQQSTYLSVRKRTTQTINDNKECLLNSNAVTVMVPEVLRTKLRGTRSVLCLQSGLQGPKYGWFLGCSPQVRVVWVHGNSGLVMPVVVFAELLCGLCSLWCSLGWSYWHSINLQDSFQLGSKNQV